MDENKELLTIGDAGNSELDMREPGLSSLLNAKTLKTINSVAKMYASSAMVPDTYKGNVANCFVAVELADRMGVSPTLVMQNLYIVRGKPSWSGQACKALIDGCGKYKKTYYSMLGEVGSMDRACVLNAIEQSGQLIAGPMVSMKMAADEGWINKSGSKWKTMPENMLRYRAAAFFARTECPNVLMGFQTVEEVQDVKGYEEEKQGKVVIEVK